MPASPLSGLPMRAALHPTDGLYFAVREIAPGELQDPFLHQTIDRLPGRESIIHIPADEVGHAPRHTAPSGLIFSVGRSGSTLLSQLLKKAGEIVVYSEPQVINEILLPPHRWKRADVVAALKSLGLVLSRHAEKPYILKFTSWNTLFCDLVGEAFPESPWIFSLRDPLEVAVSVMADPPGWYRREQAPAQKLASVVDPDYASRPTEEFVARVYGALCAAAARIDPRKGRLIEYDDLPSTVWDAVAPHFSLALDEEARERMAAAARTYSKSRIGEDAEFARDTETKQAAASDALRRATDTFARPALQRLKTRLG